MIEIDEYSFEENNLKDLTFLTYSLKIVIFPVNLPL